MFLLIAGISFGASCIGYAIYSGVTAESQSERNAEYREKVNKYTVQQGHPISSSYKHLEENHLEENLLNDV